MVLTDKTGTLTKGEMSIKKLYINKKEYNLNLDRQPKNADGSPKSSKNKRPGQPKDSADAYEQELWDINHGFDKDKKEKEAQANRAKEVIDDDNDELRTVIQNPDGRDSHKTLLFFECLALT